MYTSILVLLPTGGKHGDSLTLEPGNNNESFQRVGTVLYTLLLGILSNLSYKREKSGVMCLYRAVVAQTDIHILPFFVAGV